MTRSGLKDVELLDKVLHEFRSGRGKATIHDTPFGLMLGVSAGNSGSLDAVATYGVRGSGIDFANEYGEIVQAIARGEYDAVYEISNEEWLLFLDILDEVENLDVDEDELWETRSDN
ncbi:hypothetical protein QA600_05805 [Natronococcus sp. A-GB1]|uniref:hypothetical protein n=1 Tax=Natronococcus sp. A-GB1 TaxID=3037648 RepID=UPI00241F75E4|nr:hypothetical protein [Natronococcus sp. A-GB1]MDG5758851.1 hypothetical protein [Natronococcus sp. A-GB1]